MDQMILSVPSINHLKSVIGCIIDFCALDKLNLLNCYFHRPQHKKPARSITSSQSIPFTTTQKQPMDMFRAIMMVEKQWFWVICWLE
jgi:hypothetical protein